MRESIKADPVLNSNLKSSPKRVLVVDDEDLARSRIVRFLRESPYEFEILESQNGIEAIKKIRERKPDLIFLDVEMPGLNGFDVLAQVSERSFSIVFQTAFGDYAIQAFEESACDYLLKPFTQDRFNKALERAITFRERTHSLNRLEDLLHQKDIWLSKLSIKKGSKTDVVSVNDIISFVSRDHYTCVFTENNEYITEIALNWLEERLNPKVFVRCHRNNICRMSAIRQIGGTEDSFITLSNDQRLPLSRSRRKDLLERIKEQA